MFSKCKSSKFSKDVKFTVIQTTVVECIIKEFDFSQMLDVEDVFFLVYPAFPLDSSRQLMNSFLLASTFMRYCVIESNSTTMSKSDKNKESRTESLGLLLLVEWR